MPNSRTHILLTSAGRRGVLVRIFKRELETVFPGSKVFATDMYPEMSSACQLSDGGFAVPRVTADDYLPRLLEICEQNDIGLIVPTIDTELLFLAQNQALLAEKGIKTVISGENLIRTCRDKRLTHDFFISHGLGSAEIRDPKTTEQFPLFAKPYDGSCSVNIHLLKTREDLTPALLADPKLIFLEYLSPDEHDEFTVDMYFDQSGVQKCLVPRQRLETRAGEVSKGKTVWLPALEILKEKLGSVHEARGCLTVQVFVHRATGKVSGIEINPRFGGGYPLSDDAGATYVKWVIQEYLESEKVGPFDGWERNLTMLRYDDHVLVRGSDS